MLTYNLPLLFLTDEADLSSSSAVLRPFLEAKAYSKQALWRRRRRRRLSSMEAILISCLGALEKAAFDRVKLFAAVKD